MSDKFAKLKAGKFFGIGVLLVMALAFWALFKILSPHNFGTGSLMAGYLQTSIQYAVGGCGLYFIVVMGLFITGTMLAASFSLDTSVRRRSLALVVPSAVFIWAAIWFARLCRSPISSPCALCELRIGKAAIVRTSTALVTRRVK